MFPRRVCQDEFAKTISDRCYQDRKKFISVHVHSISKRLILANRVALFLQVPSSHNCQICCAGIVVTQRSLLIDSNVGAFESKEQHRIMHKGSEKRLVFIPLAFYCLVLRVVKQIVCVFLSRGSENSSLRSPRLCMSKKQNRPSEVCNSCMSEVGKLSTISFARCHGYLSRLLSDTADTKVEKPCSRLLWGFSRR